MSAGPLLSIVIPTRNRYGYLRQAVQSCLQKTRYTVEVIVSDNASEDASATLSAEFPAVQWIRQERLLPFWEHLNFVTRQGTAPLMKMLCDDDWLPDGAIDREVEAMLESPQLAAVASARSELDASGELVRLCRFSEQRRALGGGALFWSMLLHENVVGPPSNVTFRRCLFRGYPGKFEYARDFAAWIQLAERGPILFLPEPGCNFRLHAANATKTQVLLGNDFLEVQALRKECLRRLPWYFRPGAAIVYAWIWSYRLARRIAKLALLGEFSALRSFLGHALAYRPDPLPRDS